MWELYPDGRRRDTGCGPRKQLLGALLNENGNF
jgi:hypothetical protein